MVRGTTGYNPGLHYDCAATWSRRWDIWATAAGEAASKQQGSKTGADPAASADMLWGLGMPAKA